MGPFKKGWFTLSRALYLAFALFLAATECGAADGAVKTKSVFGWIEHVRIGTSGLEMTAKLDTGAETSSLDAVNIRRYKSNGKSWVRFTVAEKTGGRRLVFRRPLTRTIRVKQHDGSSQRRLVVEVEVCLGDLYERTEVSLIDRGEFEHPVLLGRNFLAGKIVVDPGVVHVTEPECSAEKAAP